MAIVSSMGLNNVLSSVQNKNKVKLTFPSAEQVPRRDQQLSRAIVGTLTSRDRVPGAAQCLIMESLIHWLLLAGKAPSTDWCGQIKLLHLSTWLDSQGGLGTPARR